MLKCEEIYYQDCRVGLIVTTVVSSVKIFDEMMIFMSAGISGLKEAIIWNFSMPLAF